MMWLKVLRRQSKPVGGKRDALFDAYWAPKGGRMYDYSEEETIALGEKHWLFPELRATTEDLLTVRR